MQKLQPAMRVVPRLGDGLETLNCDETCGRPRQWYTKVRISARAFEVGAGDHAIQPSTSDETFMGTYLRKYRDETPLDK